MKIAAARANRQLGELNGRVAEAVIEAACEVAGGRWNEQFPVGVLQGGGGTAANMNANEVIANRAAELLGSVRGHYDVVHPNDHVNRSQSTNDVYPTALQVALMRTGRAAIGWLRHLVATLHASADAAGDQERLGRTCLRDALPVSIRATMRGAAHALSRTIADLSGSLDSLRFVPLGATAVGDGAGSPDGFRDLAVARCRQPGA